MFTNYVKCDIIILYEKTIAVNKEETNMLHGDYNELMDLKFNGIFSGSLFFARRKGEKKVLIVCLERDGVVRTLNGETISKWGDDIAHNFEVVTREGDWAFGELWDFLR